MKANREQARGFFARDVAEHQMQVLRDDGLYRHLRFRRPDSFAYYFDLITYPGGLLFRGDMGAYAFERLDDMFEFFRTDAGRGDGINPGYWAEKLVAIDRSGLKEFDEDAFRSRVMWDLIQWMRYNRDRTTKEERRELWDHVVWEVIDAEEDVDGARKKIALHDFQHQVNSRLQFEFHDCWEWSFDDYRFHFYWACYAIAWAVKQYDQHKAGAGS